jgi:threonine/homoserine/homoserine lactone efflux protein
LKHLYLFALTSFLLIIMPGADTAIATKNTLSMGRAGGIRTVLGTCCAVLIHTTAAIAGLSAIIVKSAFLFSLFKYVGSAYLVYLGVKNLLALLHQKPKEEVLESIEEKYDGKYCFKQGFITNILNINVAIFFYTFLPQFVDPGKGTFLPFLVLGITYCLLKAAWYIFYVYMIDTISNFMKKPRIQAVFEGAISVVLIGFGAKLALEMKR